MYFHELNPVGLPQEVADVRLAQAQPVGTGALELIFCWLAMFCLYIYV